MNISVNVNGDVTVVGFEGNLDTNTAPEAQDRLDELASDQRAVTKERTTVSFADFPGNALDIESIPDSVRCQQGQGSVLDAIKLATGFRSPQLIIELRGQFSTGIEPVQRDSLWKPRVGQARSAKGELRLVGARRRFLGSR